MRRVAIRFGLAALSNRHFDNILFPIGTRHDEYLPRYAAAGLDALELAVAYHGLELPPEVAAWVDQAPPGFVFAAKLWKGAVAPDGEWDDAAIAAAGQGLDALRDALGARCGRVVAQFPARFEATPARHEWLEDLLALAPDRLAVELRHDSWWSDDTHALLTGRRVPVVWSTFDGAPAPAWDTGPDRYIRFTGRAHRSKRTRGRPLPRRDRLHDILDVRERLAAAPGRETVVIVTNPFEGNAVDSLPRIVAALGGPERANHLRRGPGEPLL